MIRNPSIKPIAPALKPPISTAGRPLPTVVLLHTTGPGRHYDWMLADPAHPSGRLLTFRISRSPRQWRPGMVLIAKALPPHRRVYLEFEGKLTPDADGRPRGSVKRVDRGEFRVGLWSARRLVITARYDHFVGRVTLTRLNSDRWRMRMIALTSGKEFHPSSRILAGLSTEDRSSMKRKPSIDHETLLIRELRNDPEFAAEYLKAAMEDADEPRVLLDALRQVAEARGGIAKVAKAAGIERESLDRALSTKGNPRFSTLVAVTRAIGLKLTVEAA